MEHTRTTSGLPTLGRRLVTAGNKLVTASPALLALVVILMVVLLFAGLLSLPISAANGESTPPYDAIFTAASAVTVTGLTTVNTAEHWSFFGQVVILLGIQIGGLGIVTIALLLSRAVTRHLGVRGRILAQQGIGTTRLGEVQSLLRIVIVTSLALELALAVILVPRFIIVEESFLTGLWHGIFYAISAFNNAGFVVHPDGLLGFEGDLWILVPIMVGVFIGSFGFPIFLVLMVVKWQWRRWTLHTKLTLSTTTILLVAGAALWGLLEWSNVKTIGDMSVADKLFHALFASTMMRSGGFSLVDPSDSNAITLLATDALMFVGGGSASTAGGIKVTTIAVLFLAILAEAKGDKHLMIFGRNIPEDALRVAISVTFLGATLVLGATGLIMLVSDAPLDRILFEVISGFATCGLSVGLSEELPPAGKYVLAALMFAGRVGPIGLASALAIRRRNLLFRYPEERPIIG
ncbi:Trk-type K+ transport system membrane component [Glaciihabitans tibetensis]|uniref:Trk-type K+ transport system membrane component n=1 Tax=Glaciihabitans tibetensis TaxID=1266600 RepID=A0A2T0VG52_9MICO|nr:potassium transporter TrkG [Glaciihabitans tibetensis]PRY69187.1 Trk-type K+ transport system membrane component [Glaciihabitans tibetensis]